MKRAVFLLMILCSFLACKNHPIVEQEKQEVILRDAEINLMFQLIFCEQGYAILEVISSSNPQLLEEYAFKIIDLPASITSQADWESKDYIGTLRMTGKTLACELYAKPFPGEPTNQPTEDFPLVEIIDIRENP